MFDSTACGRQFHRYDLQYIRLFASGKKSSWYEGFIFWLLFRYYVELSKVFLMSVREYRLSMILILSRYRGKRYE